MGISLDTECHSINFFKENSYTKTRKGRKGETKLHQSAMTDNRI
jgi:hypothetical protein